jgi:putative tricarboxylic transport membrane protein
MPPTSAIIMLSCIYWGALFGGAITSVLFNIPGEPWSVGDDLRRLPDGAAGRAGEALTASFTSSFIGALFAVDHDHVPRTAGREVRAQVRPAGILLRLPADVLQLHRHGQGLGVEDARGDDAGLRARRDRHGQHHRPAAPHVRLPGDDARRRLPDRRDRLFGIGEILLSMEEGLSFTGKSAKINPKVVLETWKKLPHYWLTSLRSCLIGCWMGITPGGATPASFMSYGVAKRMSKNGDRFGKGEIEGVVAPETPAHAAGTQRAPADAGARDSRLAHCGRVARRLLIWGLQPGPLLFVEQKDFVWGLIASMYIGNLAGLVIVLTCVPLFAAILRVPFSIIAP